MRLSFVTSPATVKSATCGGCSPLPNVFSVRWFASYADEAAYRSSYSALTQNHEWITSSVPALQTWGASLEETLELLPTRRSLLRHRAEEQRPEAHRASRQEAEKQPEGGGEGKDEAQAPPPVTCPGNRHGTRIPRSGAIRPRLGPGVPTRDRSHAARWRPRSRARRRSGPRVP